MSMSLSGFQFFQCLFCSSRIFAFCCVLVCSAGLVVLVWFPVCFLSFCILVSLAFGGGIAHV